MICFSRLPPSNRLQGRGTEELRSRLGRFGTEKLVMRLQSIQYILVISFFLCPVEGGDKKRRGHFAATFWSRSITPSQHFYRSSPSKSTHVHVSKRKTRYGVVEWDKRLAAKLAERGLLFPLLLIFWIFASGAWAKPFVIIEKHNQSIEVGPGPNAVRLKSDESFVLTCQIAGVSSYDQVSHVTWTYENELDEAFRIETLDNDDIDYDHVMGETTYRFDHHPTSADAGVYNCTFYQGTEIMAKGTIRLTCDPVPKEGARSWRGLKEDDPFRRDYKHVPSYTIYPGDGQTLECRATAYPRPKFQWFRIKPGIEGDDVIGTASRVAIPDRSKTWRVSDSSSSEEDDDDLDETVHVIADGDILRLVNVRFEDRGYYCCTANNSDDYSLNLYFLIRVKNPLAVLWPLLGLGIIAASMAVIVGTSEHYRRRSEANEERVFRVKEKIEDADGVPMTQMDALGANVKQRVTAKAHIKETKQ